MVSQLSSQLGSQLSKQFSLASIVGMVAVSFALTACDKTETTPVDRDAANKKAREGVIAGDALKSMDKAKAGAEEASKMAEEKLKKTD